MSRSDSPSRLVAIDWMRGLVMVLMTIDHASDAFNGGRVFSDSVSMWKPGTHLAFDQFMTRWITHLCAPTFVFLAGAALSLSVARREARGEPASSIDRHIVTRGLIIAALDPLWMSLGFSLWHRVILQVLYAIGLSLVWMAALRRLPWRALALSALTLLIAIDLVVSHRIESGGAAAGNAPLAVGLLVTGGRYWDYLIVGYPLFSWLAIMMLGWAFGSWLAARPGVRPEGRLAIAGALSLIVFGVLRGYDHFGNMGLHRDDNSLVQWLHVSKYPPSLTYCTLELGIMALFLAAFFRISRGGSPAVLGPLGVLGANALFFYLLHLHLMMAASYALGVHQKLGVGSAYVATAATVFVLYFACRWYGRYKSTHHNFVTRYV